MFKKKNKRIKLIILIGALLGLIRSVFFFKKEIVKATTSDILQNLMNTIESNEPTEKIFEGKAMPENLYKKALEGRQRKTAQITTMSLNKMQFINSGLNIKTNDLLNVLYNSNESVQAGIRYACKSKTCKITQKEINASYLAILKELKPGKTKYSRLDNSDVDKRVNSQFVLLSNDETNKANFNEGSIGEDLFMNGVSSDSDYDLQIDIKNIGDLLFESFNAPIETVFYKLPNGYGQKKSSGNGNSNDSSTEEELTTLLKNLLTQSGSNNTGIISNGGSKPTTTNKTNTKNTATSKNNKENKVEINDKGLQDFFKKNDFTQKSTTQKPGIQGNICIDGVSEGPETTNTTEEAIDSKNITEYLATVQDQIATYENIFPENKDIPNLANDPAFSGLSENETNQLIEEHIDSLFDTEATQSCIKNCSSLPPSEKVVCEIQCLCFAISRPKEKDPRLTSMNDMLKLRFCMVPAKSMAIPKGKSIYSLDDILSRIQANLQNVVQGGDMIKFQRTKEFLENPIADFSWSKLFSFEFKLNMKSMFNNKSDNAKKDQESSYVKKLEEKTGKSQTLGIKTNKYIVVADPIKNKIYKEYGSSLADYEKKYAEELANLEKTSTESSISGIYGEKAQMLSAISQFLSKNFEFRQKMGEEIGGINNIVDMLQNKL